ncbi:hypothetical protein DFJ73DRAFT_956945, partial [Zopfochytrium polystomum]
MSSSKDSRESRRTRSSKSDSHHKTSSALSADSAHSDMMVERDSHRAVNPQSTEYDLSDSAPDASPSSKTMAEAGVRTGGWGPSSTSAPSAKSPGPINSSATISLDTIKAQMNLRSEHLRMLLGWREKDEQAKREHENRVMQCETKLASIEDEIAKLSDRLEQARRNKAEEETKRAGAEKAVELLIRRMADSDQDIERLSAEVEKLGTALMGSTQFQSDLSSGLAVRMAAGSSNEADDAEGYPSRRVEENDDRSNDEADYDENPISHGGYEGEEQNRYGYDNTEEEDGSPRDKEDVQDERNNSSISVRDEGDLDHIKPCLEFNLGRPCDETGEDHYHVCAYCRSSRHSYFECDQKGCICVYYNRSQCRENKCVRINICIYCLSDHPFTSCPLMTPEIKLASDEFCLNWNSMSFCHAPHCRRRHQCMYCHETHSVLDCPGLLESFMKNPQYDRIYKLYRRKVIYNRQDHQDYPRGGSAGANAQNKFGSGADARRSGWERSGGEEGGRVDRYSGDRYDGVSRKRRSRGDRDVEPDATGNGRARDRSHERTRSGGDGLETDTNTRSSGGRRTINRNSYAMADASPSEPLGGRYEQDSRRRGDREYESTSGSAKRLKTDSASGRADGDRYAISSSRSRGWEQDDGGHGNSSANHSSSDNYRSGYSGTAHMPPPPPPPPPPPTDEASRHRDRIEDRYSSTQQSDKGRRSTTFGGDERSSVAFPGDQGGRGVSDRPVGRRDVYRGRGERARDDGSGEGVERGSGGQHFSAGESRRDRDGERERDPRDRGDRAERGDRGMERSDRERERERDREREPRDRDRERE